MIFGCLRLAFEEGHPEVPVCTSCHGAHEIHSPDDRKAMLSSTCASCHEEIYETYSASVHGRALEVDNPHVPGCTDCHTSHSMANPHSVQFHLHSPSKCIECHGDENLMQPYGIPTDVATATAKAMGQSLSMACWKRWSEKRT